MAKEAYYFSHDYGARNDPKLQKVLMKLGQEGKGVYWDLIEMLFEEGGKLMLSELESYAFALRANENCLKSLINDFGLFQKDRKSFWSNSVIKRIQERNEKSLKYSESAKSRWNKNGSEFKMDKSQFYIIHCFNEVESFFKIGITSEYISRRYSGKKMPYEYNVILQLFSDDFLKIEMEYNSLFDKYRYAPKLPFGGSNECLSLESIDELMNYETTLVAVKIINNFKSQYNFIASHKNRNAIKERKGKEIIDIIDFEIFWNDYNKKVGDKKACKKKWDNLSLDVQQKIISSLPEWKKQITDIQFQPHPQTFLNQERWNDEIKIFPKKQLNGIIDQSENKHLFG